MTLYPFSRIVACSGLQPPHWLKIHEPLNNLLRIVSVTYDVLATAKPSNLSSLLTIQPAHSTRSSKLITLCRPAVTSSRAILNRSFRYSARILRNSLLAELPSHCFVFTPIQLAPRRPYWPARRGQISYPNLHFC